MREVLITMIICTTLLGIAAIKYDVEWDKYSPRPGIECAAVYVDHQLDVDCYSVIDYNSMLQEQKRRGKILEKMP